MSESEIEEKIFDLKDGQIVEIDGDWFGACPLGAKSDDPPCLWCGKVCDDSDEVGEVCLHLNLSSECDWFLVAYPSVLDY